MIIDVRDSFIGSYYMAGGCEYYLSLQKGYFVNAAECDSELVQLMENTRKNSG
jgi:hypothetical protein